MIDKLKLAYFLMQDSDQLLALLSEFVKCILLFKNFWFCFSSSSSFDRNYVIVFILISRRALPSWPTRLHLFFMLQFAFSYFASEHTKLTVIEFAIEMAHRTVLLFISSWILCINIGRNIDTDGLVFLFIRICEVERLDILDTEYKIIWKRF